MEQFTHYLPGILLAYAAFFLGIFSPGPNILAVIGTSMSLGRRKGCLLALGVASGSFCWAMLTVIGLSGLLTAYAGALTIIKIVGGAYLIWLGVKALRSAATGNDMLLATVGAASDSPSRYYFRGLFVQMTNPKAALSWVAIISLGLQAGAPWWVAAIIVTGTTVMSVVMHLGYALTFSTAPMVRFYRRARRWIQATLGVFFCFAGMRLLFGRN
ncbi:MAG: LysE family translocator [Rhodospirillales bacterium]